jgi:hypothetical protein
MGNRTGGPGFGSSAPQRGPNNADNSSFGVNNVGSYAGGGAGAAGGGKVSIGGFRPQPGQENVNNRYGGGGGGAQSADTTSRFEVPDE